MRIVAALSHKLAATSTPLLLTLSNISSFSHFLRHHNRIAGLEDDVVFGPISVDYILVVERMLYLFPTLGTQYIDLLQSRKLRESARAGQRPATPSCSAATETRPVAFTSPVT